MDPNTPTQTPQPVPTPPPPPPNESAVQTPLPTQSMPPVMPRKTRSKLIPIIIALVILLIGAGAAYALLGKKKDDPAGVFKAALTNALSTSSIRQTSSSEGNSAAIGYDLQNIKDPKVHITGSFSVFGIDVDVEGYGNLQNTYLRYTKITGEGIDQAALGGLINKWVAVRVNGTLSEGADPSFSPLVDPRYHMFGQYIFGNFSETDRAELVDFLLTNNAYEYDATKVIKETLDGREVFNYDVTLNTNKITELNKKVATIMGLSESDISDVLSEMGEITQAKLYIDIQNKQLVKVTVSEEGETITNVYSSFNATTLPNEPKADLTSKELNDLQ